MKDNGWEWANDVPLIHSGMKIHSVEGLRYSGTTDMTINYDYIKGWLVGHAEIVNIFGDVSQVHLVSGSGSKYTDPLFIYTAELEERALVRCGLEMEFRYGVWD